MSSVPVSIDSLLSQGGVEGDQTAEMSRCILFFDGVCGLCSRAVDFVIARDTKEHFQFAPLQGETARQLLPKQLVSDLNSMVVLVQGRSYRKSAAVVRVLWHLGLGWMIVGSLLWLIPLPLRDFGYWLIAKNRYRFFGKHEACRMPTQQERRKFLP